MSETYHTQGALSAAIQAMLERVRIADGFETDIGSRVFMGRRHIEDGIEPCVVLHEAEDSAEDQAGRKPTYLINQRYVAIGYDKCDPNQPNLTAHKIIRDLKRTFFSGDVKDGRFGGKVRAVRYIGRDIGARSDGAAIVVGLIEFEVQYVEDLSAP